MLKQALEGSPGFYTGFHLKPEELSFVRECIAKRKINDHDFIAQKKNRLFSNGEVRKIKEFAFFELVRKELGYFTLSDVCYDGQIEKGREEVYFRVVRPNEPADVGPMHRDIEHHAKFDGLHTPNEKTIKCWIPIETEPGINGLMVVRNSHIGDAPLPVLLPLEPGNMVLFNDRVMHGGALNEGKRNRISIEITLVFKNELHV